MNGRKDIKENYTSSIKDRRGSRLLRGASLVARKHCYLHAILHSRGQVRIQSISYQGPTRNVNRVRKDSLAFITHQSIHLQHCQ